MALGLPLDEKDAPIRPKSEYATHTAAPGKSKTAGEMFADDDPKKSRSQSQYNSHQVGARGPDFAEPPRDADDKGESGDVETQSAHVPSQGRKCIFNFFRLVGTLLMIASLVSDYSYILKQTFSKKLFYSLYLGVLALRIFFPLILIVRYQVSKVCGAKNQLKDFDLKPGVKVKDLKADYIYKGVIMYTFLPLMFFTGSYRHLELKNFKREVGMGFVLDFFFYVLPLIMLQALNNATLI